MDHSKRHRQIRLRVNDTEEQALRQGAERRGMTLAAFVRWCALHCGVSVAAA